MTQPRRDGVLDGSCVNRPINLLNRLSAGLCQTAEQLGKRINEVFGQALAPEAWETMNPEVLETLEEILLEADVGVVATNMITDRLRVNNIDGHESGGMREELKREVLEVLNSARTTSVNSSRPRVVLVVGVNGTGKTTTVGKLAYLMRVNGERPLLCAADTFRAAGVDQLAVWANRADVDIVKSEAGVDPASVVFDAIKASRARDRNVVIVDTAGRLHTRVNLMKELEKIHRVVSREVDGAPHEVLLVLDATVGQNGLMQAKRFLESTSVTGIVLTKLDGTAKGGIAIAITAELGLPIRYVGLGEELEDLLPFSSDAYVEGLFGSPSSW